MYAVIIEGIPAVFVEWAPLNSANVTPNPLAPFDNLICPALIIEDDTIDCAIDRETGVASARAWDMRLAMDALEDADLLVDIFSAPSLSTRLDADELTGTATSITVVNTTSWPASGILYIGLETMAYGSKTGTSFTALTRAYGGYAYPHLANALQGYGQVTDRPTQWRGRKVTLWTHLVTPCGRIVEDYLCAPSDYIRQEWTGFIDKAPQVVNGTMVIHCQATVRKLDQSVGAKLEFNVVATDRFVASPNHAVSVYIEYNAGSIITADLPSDLPSTPITITRWASLLRDELLALLPAKWFVNIIVNSSEISVFVQHAVVDSLESIVWVSQGGVIAAGSYQAGPFYSSLPIAAMHFITVAPVAQADWQIAVLPSAGFGVVNDALITWESATADGNNHTLALVSPTSVVTGDTMRVLSGAIDTLNDVLQTLWSSSGTGLRGTYDTEPLGFGLAQPSALLAATAYPWDTEILPLFADDKISMLDLLGGWLALNQSCVVQRSGVLSIVRTSPNKPVAYTLDASNVLLDDIESPEPIEAPNVVNIDASVLSLSERTIIARDIPRYIAEGEIAWDFKAPGADDVTALSNALDIIALSAGQSLITVIVAPWVNAQPGDQVAFDLIHPANYDWETGARTVATMTAVVMSVATRLRDYTRECVLLLEGRIAPTRSLCPSMVVEAIDSTTALTVDDASWLIAGQSVAVYAIGDDSSPPALIVDSIASNQITFTAVHGASVGWIVTYPELGSADADQAEYAYIDTDTVWG